MRFAADVDRRNTASLYNNLAAEFGASIGGLDAKVELGFEIVNERIDRLEERGERVDARLDGLEAKIFSRLDGLEDRIGRIEEKVGDGFARIEQLLHRG